MDVVNSSPVIDVVDLVNPHRLVRILPYILRPRACNIGLIIINIGIINNSGIADNSYVA